MPTVATTCYHVSTDKLRNLTEENLKDTFHRHFNSHEPYIFIDCVTAPANRKDFAIIELAYNISPPNDFCTWRMPLYNKVESVSRIINGETYTMILGNHFKLKYVD